MKKYVKGSETVEIGPKHMLWHAIRTNDDDWCGSTASNFMHNYVTGSDVIIYPPDNCPPDLLTQMYTAVQRIAKSVVIYGHKPT